MGDYERVKKLVEMIFDKHFAITAEARVPDSSVPDYFLPNDFFQKLRYVLFMRRLMLCIRWRKHFDDHITSKLSCHESYISFVLSTCLLEHVFNPTIFDTFISVCSLVGYFNLKTLKRTGLNFRDLNCFIVMVFYENVIKDTLNRRGGFRRLVDFILHHKYLKWTSISSIDDLVSPDVPTSDDCIQSIRKKIQSELDTESRAQKLSKPTEEKEDKLSVPMAQKVLKLQENRDLIRKVGEYKEKEETKPVKLKRRIEADLGLEPLEEVWEGCSDSNSDSKTDHIAEQKKGIAECEDNCWNSDSKTDHIAEQKEDIAECEDICSNSDSKTDHIAEQKEHNAGCEDICSNSDSKTNHTSEQEENFEDWEFISRNSNPDSETNHAAEHEENNGERELISRNSNTDSEINHTAEHEENNGERELISRNSNPDSEPNHTSEQEENFEDWEFVSRNSNTDSETNHTAEQEENIAECEDTCKKKNTKDQEKTKPERK